MSVCLNWTETVHHRNSIHPFTCSVCVNQSTVKSPGLSTPLLYRTSSPTTYGSCKVAQALQLCLEARMEKPGRMMYFREREERDTFDVLEPWWRKLHYEKKKSHKLLRMMMKRHGWGGAKRKKKHHTVPECWLLVRFDKCEILQCWNWLLMSNVAQKLSRPEPTFLGWHTGDPCQKICFVFVA